MLPALPTVDINILVSAFEFVDHFMPTEIKTNSKCQNLKSDCRCFLKIKLKNANNLKINMQYI